MIAPPGGAATLVQPPTSAGVPKAADLQLSTLDYDERGQATITGQAAPGTTVRAYIDDKMVAEGMAGADGRWRLAPAAPIDNGKHKLRLDRLAMDGKPTSRLEKVPRGMGKAISISPDAPDSSAATRPAPRRSSARKAGLAGCSSILRDGCWSAKGATGA